MAAHVSEKVMGVDEIPEVIDTRHTYESASAKIAGIPLNQKQPTFWFIMAGIGFFGLLILLAALGKLFANGIGIWGNNVPVGWGFDIINFVWWIGIGHAGTLISAILFLFRQEWRTSINRFAESMTIFAVMCAGLFPLIHMGRPWLFYWLLPYPNVMQMWPQFRSPLMWDVFAVSTYFSVSLLFWFTGLIPDFANMRDRAVTPLARKICGIFALGWRNSAMHWQRYETAYLILAGLSTPLVVSVHSVVSLDFSAGIIPGWHTTIFPPYFVAGAIYSGFAMVLTFAIPVRKIYGLKDLITQKHLDVMSKVMLATGMMVTYGYGMEAFIAWYSGAPFERFMMWNRAVDGPYNWSYWLLILCNCLIPQLLWLKKFRTSPVPLFFISIVINIGMWFERFVIIVTSLNRDFVPSSWGMYMPTVWDWATFIGTIGFFIFNMFLFIRFLPMFSLFEVRELLHRKKGHGHGHH
jgi:Ni/Fe-hydrogenase subunit HybB-like protein